MNISFCCSSLQLPPRPPACSYSARCCQAALRHTDGPRTVALAASLHGRHCPCRGLVSRDTTPTPSSPEKRNFLDTTPTPLANAPLARLVDQVRKISFFCFRFRRSFFLPPRSGHNTDSPPIIFFPLFSDEQVKSELYSHEHAQSVYMYWSPQAN